MENVYSKIQLWKFLSSDPWKMPKSKQQIPQGPMPTDRRINMDFQQ